jgi:hypothetical protein
MRTCDDFSPDFIKWKSKRAGENRGTILTNNLGDMAMGRSVSSVVGVVALAVYFAGAAVAQNRLTVPGVGTPGGAALAHAANSFLPLPDPAQADQIEEYLRLSGDMDAFRLRWVVALEKNRAQGAPWWPESFWAAMKDEMEKADLLPMYITLFQHDVSRELMQKVLDSLRRRGADRFRGSKEYAKLVDPSLGLDGDIDKLKRAKTQEVLNRVYAEFKPQLTAARLKYQAEHPEFAEK